MLSSSVWYFGRTSDSVLLPKYEGVTRDRHAVYLSHLFSLFAGKQNEDSHPIVHITLEGSFMDKGVPSHYYCSLFC